MEEKNGSVTMYESEKKRKWQKENTVFIGVKLQKGADKEMIAFLQSHIDPEKKIGYQTIIKAALSEYMERHADPQPSEYKPDRPFWEE